MRKRTGYSTSIFFTTLVIAVCLDGFTDITTGEVSAYMTAGMLVALTVHVLFEKEQPSE